MFFISNVNDETFVLEVNGIEWDCKISGRLVPVKDGNGLAGGSFESYESDQLDFTLVTEDLDEDFDNFIEETKQYVEDNKLAILEKLEEELYEFLRK